MSKPVHIVEPCQLAHIAEYNVTKGEDPEVAAKYVAKINNYLKIFVKPIESEFANSKHYVCFNCGEALTGLMATLMAKGGGFHWGIVHGEGFCGNCTWPCRAYHYLKDDDGSELLTLRGLTLQYLPEYVTKKGNDNDSQTSEDQSTE